MASAVGARFAALAAMAALRLCSAARDTLDADRIVIVSQNHKGARGKTTKAPDGPQRLTDKQLQEIRSKASKFTEGHSQTKSNSGGADVQSSQKPGRPGGGRGPLLPPKATGLDSATSGAKGGPMEGEKKPMFPPTTTTTTTLWMNEHGEYVNEFGEIVDEQNYHAPAKILKKKKKSEVELHVGALWHDETEPAPIYFELERPD